MLAEEVMLFGILGILTSAFISFYVKGKDEKTVILCSLQGAFTGWLSGMIWVYLTGGLEVTLYAFVLPVFISAFFTIMILQRHPHTTGSVEKNTGILATIGLFAIVFFVAFSSMPIAYQPSFNTESFSVQTLDWNPSETIVDIQDVEPTYSIPIDITGSKTSITSLYTMSEDASYRSTLNFKVFFKPKAEWMQPYVKIGVYKDIDKNGELSDGDILWSDANYKLVTDNSRWRTNCLWEDNVAKYGITSYNGKLLPIFHAQQLTQTKNEANVNFFNTPSGFTPQNDMLTWQDGKLTEEIISYASINTGESSTISGSIYCGPDASTDNIIVVSAYDARNTNPFADNLQPLQEYIIPFDVTATPQEVTVMGVPSVMVLVGLGVLLFAGLLYYRKELF
jgi:hypothetical protein